jgi:hypothetical protein
MKIRMGFVSNSSSASFTIRWKIISDDQDFTVEEAVDELLMWDDERIIAEVTKSTLRVGKNEFLSGFWTSMMNCPGDFDKAAQDFVFTLTVRTKALGNRGYEILDMSIEED